MGGGEKFHLSPLLLRHNSWALHAPNDVIIWESWRSGNGDDNKGVGSEEKSFYTRSSSRRFLLSNNNGGSSFILPSLDQLSGSISPSGR